jgi:hypothetical protein
MIAAPLILSLLAAASPNAFVVPMPDDADVFLVDIDLDGSGDVAVLDGFKLTVYPTANRDYPLTLTLPKNARALDITTHPDTGKIAAIAVCGSEIRQFSFDGKANGKRLFDHHSYLSEGDTPYRYVMVFERNGESIFFLPSVGAIELRTWSGELRERIEPETVDRFEEVTGYSRSRSTIGNAGSLEFFIHQSIGNEPAFIEKQWEDASGPRAHSPLMARSDFHKLDSPGDQWPWFALQPDDEESTRIRCAVRPHPLETHVRIDTTLSDPVAGGIGPARKYPGMLTKLNSRLPDFNGDGFTDLLLWNTDRPSVSPSSIARMAVNQHWPIRLTTHLFDPETNRYTARPFATLSVRASIDALLQGSYGSPIHDAVVKDIDADGRTDVCFTVDGQTYVRWMMEERGAHAEEIHLKEPIQHVSFNQALDNTDRVTIGLRTEHELYVLDPE